MAVLIACAVGFGFYMESVGRASGLVEGYAAARDETAAAAWANTPQGKAAYQLAQAGSIESLTRCDLPGWRIEKGACYPDKAPGRKLHTPEKRGEIPAGHSRPHIGEGCPRSPDVPSRWTPEYGGAARKRRQHETTG